jgi:nitrogen regulatory protein PII
MAKVFGDTEVAANKRHETLLRRIVPEFPEADHCIESAITAVTKGTHTGESGDGKIFVLAVEESVRIRTGQTGETTIG